MFKLTSKIDNIYFVECQECGQSMYITDERYETNEPMMCLTCEHVDCFVEEPKK